jgi:hypothetical protein
LEVRTSYSLVLQYQRLGEVAKALLRVVDLDAERLRRYEVFDPGQTAGLSQAFGLDAGLSREYQRRAWI